MAILYRASGRKLQPLLPARYPGDLLVVGARDDMAGVCRTRRPMCSTRMGERLSTLTKPGAPGTGAVSVTVALRGSNGGRAQDDERCGRVFGAVPILALLIQRQPCGSFGSSLAVVPAPWWAPLVPP